MKNTKRYLQTLGKIYQEKGLKAAIAHDLVATFSSGMSRAENLENYAFAIMEDAENTIAPWIADPTESTRLWGEVKRTNSRLQVKINDEDLVRKEGREAALSLAGATAGLAVVGAVMYGASLLEKYSGSSGGMPF